MRLFLVLFVSLVPVVKAEQANDFAAVHAIFSKYCMDCHESQDAEANLVLESFETLMKGGESGASIVPGKSSESLLVKYVEGTLEKDGKKKIMPPGKKKKLEPAEIAVIRSWIDAGALPPAQEIVRELKVPNIAPKVQPARRILALAHAPKEKLIATARYGEVDLISTESHSLLRTLTGHRGSVNAVAFSSDGAYVFAASGENALIGEVKQWNTADGALVKTFEGHKDILYSVAVSPDGKILATGSYDQKIKLWDVATGKEIKTLHGHNGCVFGLAFRADGKILASASGDRTVKLWNVERGERVETLSQPTKEVNAVAFSPDGAKLYAGGVDNRIRVWKISEAALETTNPIQESRYAHEGAILRLVFSEDGKYLLSSADDRTVKLWDAGTLRERLLLENQPDWVAGLCIVPTKKIMVGRLDGTLATYDFHGKVIATNVLTAAAKPAVTQK